MTPGHADQPAPTPGEDTPDIDPAEMLRAIRSQQDKVRERGPDGRLLYGAWGIAWLIGYLAMYLSADDAGGPARWAYLTLFSLLGAAAALSIVHSILTTRGVRGVSNRAGAMYGWSWILGFVAFGLILGGIARADASGVVMALASNGVACLVVGMEYLFAGTLFQSTRSYVLGGWILLVAAIATFVGIDHTYQVMAFLGGGGLLVMAVIEQVLRSRRRAVGAA